MWYGTAASRLALLLGVLAASALFSVPGARARAVPQPTHAPAPTPASSAAAASQGGVGVAADGGTPAITSVYRSDSRACEQVCAAGGLRSVNGGTPGQALCFGLDNQKGGNVPGTVMPGQSDCQFSMRGTWYYTKAGYSCACVSSSVAPLLTWEQSAACPAGRSGANTAPNVCRLRNPKKTTEFVMGWVDSAAGTCNVPGRNWTQYTVVASSTNDLRVLCGPAEYEGQHLESYAPSTSLYQQPCPTAAKVANTPLLAGCAAVDVQLRTSRGSSCPTTDTNNCWTRVRVGTLAGWLIEGQKDPSLLDGCSFAFGVLANSACYPEVSEVYYSSRGALPLYQQPDLAALKAATIPACAPLRVYRFSTRHTAASVPDHLCWAKAEFNGVTGWVTQFRDKRGSATLPCAVTEQEWMVQLFKPGTCTQTDVDTQCQAYYFPSSNNGGYTRNLLARPQVNSQWGCCQECGMREDCMAWSHKFTYPVGSCNLTWDAGQALDPAVGWAASKVIRQPAPDCSPSLGNEYCLNCGATSSLRLTCLASGTPCKAYYKSGSKLLSRTVQLCSHADHQPSGSGGTAVSVQGACPTFITFQSQRYSFKSRQWVPPSGTGAECSSVPDCTEALDNTYCLHCGATNKWRLTCLASGTPCRVSYENNGRQESAILSLCSHADYAPQGATSAASGGCRQYISRDGTRYNFADARTTVPTGCGAAECGEPPFCAPQRTTQRSSKGSSTTVPQSVAVAASSCKVAICEDTFHTTHCAYCGTKTGKLLTCVGSGGIACTPKNGQNLYHCASFMYMPQANVGASKCPPWVTSDGERYQLGKAETSYKLISSSMCPLCTGHTGYTFARGSDAAPNNRLFRSFGTLDLLRQLCNKIPQCQGFNTDGWALGANTPVVAWAGAKDVCAGVYIKKSVAPAAPKQGDLRLDTPVYQMLDTSRTLEAKGRLQIFKDNSWRPFCPKGFDMFAAHVACRQLDYNTSNPLAYSVYKPSTTADVPTVSWLGDACRTWHTRLEECDGFEWSSGSLLSDCAKRTVDAGLVCRMPLAVAPCNDWRMGWTWEVKPGASASPAISVNVTDPKQCCLFCTWTKSCQQWNVRIHRTWPAQKLETPITYTCELYEDDMAGGLLRKKWYDSEEFDVASGQVAAVSKASYACPHTCRFCQNYYWDGEEASVFSKLDSLVWSNDNHKIMMAGVIASVWSASDPNFTVGWRHIFRTQRGFDCARRHLKEVLSCTRLWTNDVQALVDRCLEGIGIVTGIPGKKKFAEELLKTKTATEFILALTSNQLPDARALMADAFRRAAVVPIGDALAQAGIVNRFTHYRASDSLAYLGCCYEPFEAVGKSQQELGPEAYARWLTMLKKTCPTV